MVTCISVDLMVGNGVMRAGNFSPATTYLAPLNKDGDQRGAGFDGFRHQSYGLTAMLALALAFLDS